MRFPTLPTAIALAVQTLCVGAVQAQVLSPPQALIEAPVLPGEHLSDWVLRNAHPLADTTGLHWRVDAEVLAQNQLRNAVLQALRWHKGGQMSPAARTALADWLEALPLTGRLPLAGTDPRWLQAARLQDPVLADNHHPVLTTRPRWVAVLDERAQPCLVEHRPGAVARHYLLACSQAGVVPEMDAVDRVWLMQPDGRVSQHGIASWNLEPQPELAPGAWIWAPSRMAALPDAVSDNLARFLATQLPAEFLPPESRPAESLAGRGRVDGHLAMPYTPRAAAYSSNDWGEVGYLQTPSARLVGTGSARFNISHVYPYTRGNIKLQPLDWFEAGFRYTDVANVLYGPAALSGSQSYKDKSFDFKVRLLKEDATWPDVAVGFRDIGGTGLFSSEYLVASKRWGDWDASLGLGWGNLGTRGNVTNPMAWVLGSTYKTRTAANVGQGGTVHLGNMFKGPTALIAGLQWQTPYDKWLFKAELDGNNYQNEFAGNNQTVRSPLNLGLVYRYSPFVDFSVGLERGNKAMAGFSLHGRLDQLHSPKVWDAPLPSVQATAPANLPAPGWRGVAQNVELYTGWEVRQVLEQGQDLVLAIEMDSTLYLQERIERVVTVLHASTPPHIDRFVLQLQEHGLPLSQVRIDRATWVAQHVAPLPPSTRMTAQTVSPVVDKDRAQGTAQVQSTPGFGWEWGPSYSQILGGPDGFVLYQLGLQAKAEHRFNDNTWLTGLTNLRVLDNYDKFKYTAPSNLPRVRTYQREFTTTSRTTLPLLQLTQVHDLGDGHYASAYGGMLESMYGGVGGEWLYRPWRSPLAMGVDVNHVRQRDFTQHLGLRDYTVNTGHATLYWDTGWNDVQVKLSAGRYLAGDKGVTVDIKRTFDNGVSMGAWLTKTNLSAAQYGEGSFDKGVYVQIPFDAMLPKSGPGVANIMWSPLTRDGGARLNRRFTLFDLTQARSPRAFQWGSGGPKAQATGDDTSYILKESWPHPLKDIGQTTYLLGQQVADIPGSTWLAAGGLVLASSMLDKRADHWAQTHQDGRWKAAGSAANSIPLMLGVGTGALYLGLGGEQASTTAETALRAVGYTLVANLGVRYVVGRSRPTEGNGPADFHGLQHGNSKTGFVSNHVSTAFALATPFAQEYQAPWLYGLAAASSFGRVQKRAHWVSDTVAGAMLGYGIGALLSEQQTSRSPRLSITPAAVTANWKF